MNSPTQSKGNEFIDLPGDQPNLSQNESDDENELVGVVRVDNYLINRNIESPELGYHLPVSGPRLSNMPQTGGYQIRGNAFIAGHSMSNAFGGFHRSGFRSLPTSVIPDTLGESNDISTEFEADSSTDTDRLKSRVDNIELSIGLGLSFGLLLMGMSTANFLYTILAAIVAIVAVAHYED